MDKKYNNQISQISSQKRTLYLISIFGPDRTGITREFSGIFARRNLNIIDVEAIAMRGYFIMPFLVDFGNLDKDKFKEVEKDMKETALRLDLTIKIEEYKEYKKDKNIIYVSTIGRDKPGIIYGFTSLFAGLNLNVERMKTIGREDLAVTEYRLDIGGKKISDMRKKIYETASEIGVDVIVRDRNTYERAKKLVVFDLDGTLIDKEIIDEIAKFANVEDEVKKITKDAMEGRLEFKKAIKDRVKLFAGIDENVLKNMADEVVFTPEAKELIYRLKELNYRTAIISGAFTVFTDVLKEKYPVDYAYGNKFEIKDGKLTGNLEGKIIDAYGKAKIMKEIAKKEGISINDIIAVGDGANDRIMIKKAGLGIALNPKKILKKFSDGVISRNAIKGLIMCIDKEKGF
ncbi:MAG: phosphoserine phosphatase SerB [Candidatus Altiarchaeum hamiconexum]|nr:phosphoserine phosphatase SerB [Candidatus Altarchaeum hamiconexum]